MPEEFGFDEVGGDRAAIDRRKSLARPDAFVVDGAGDEFLARARGAAEHHRCVRPRDAADHPAQMLRGGAVADDRCFARSLAAALFAIFPPVSPHFAPPTWPPPPQ